MRKTYHHGNLRDVVIETTLRLVEEEGVGRLSMREIARRAGVSHGAPYNHFSDRTAVLAAIAEDSFHRLAEAMRTAVRQSPPHPHARFEACGRAYVAFAVANPARFRIMFRPELANPERHPAVDQGAKQAFQVLVELVEESQRAGLAKRMDPRALVMTGWSTAHGLASLLVDGPLSRGGSDQPVDGAEQSSAVFETLGALLGNE